MKKIKLNRMCISDWRGKNLDVCFNEKVTKISAKNEVGKTTLINAWNWVFTSYTSSTATKNQELFDNRKPLTHETPIASVRLEVEIDGKAHTIERTAQAKFTRPQGSIEYVKAPTDTYTTIVDGFVISARDFNNWVENNICKVELIPFMLDGAFFTTLVEEDKTKARKMLSHVVGNILFEDFMGDFSMIEPLLEKATVEQLIANSSAEHRKLVQENTMTDGALKEMQQQLASIDAEEVEQVKRQIAAHKQQISDLEDKISAHMAEKSAKEQLFAALDRKQRDYSDAEAGYYLDFKVKQQELADKNRRRTEDILKERKLHYENSAHISEVIKSCEIELGAVASSIDTEMGAICPNCGAKLNSNDKELQKLYARRDALQEQLLASKKTLDTFNGVISQLNNELNELSVVEVEEFSLLPFQETPNGSQLKAEIELLENSIKEVQIPDITPLIATKNALSESLSELYVKYGRINIADDIEAQIKQLTDKKRALGANVVYLEGVIAKAKEYIEERAQIISERINKNLNGYKIIMYSTQKDGTKVPDCVVTDDKGVKFATLSNSARIRANLQMQEMFRSAFGISMPTWIDECSIFDDEHLPRPNGQVIYLYAGNSDNLVVE